MRFKILPAQEAKYRAHAWSIGASMGPLANAWTFVWWVADLWKGQYTLGPVSSPPLIGEPVNLQPFHWLAWCLLKQLNPRTHPRPKIIVIYQQAFQTVGYVTPVVLFIQDREIRRHLTILRKICLIADQSQLFPTHFVTAKLLLST